MNYKDYVTLSPKEYEILQYNYNKTFMQKKDDLYEIITKLNEQKIALINSKNNEYKDILSKLQLSIQELQKIAQSSHISTPYQNYINNNPKTHTNSSDIAIPPIRNLNKNSHHTGSILSNIFRKIKNQSAEIPNMKYHTIVANDNDISNVNVTCHSHSHNCTRQLDIIRLLLLYMTLRPTCPYIHTISRIASEQLDVYMSMLNIKA